MAEIGGPKRTKNCLPKVTLFENSFGQCNTERYEMHDDMDGESELESFVLIQKCLKLNGNVHIDYYWHGSVTAQFHTVHRNFQKVQP